MFITRQLIPATQGPEGSTAPGPTGGSRDGFPGYLQDGKGTAAQSFVSSGSEGSEIGIGLSEEKVSLNLSRCQHMSESNVRDLESDFVSQGSKQA